MQPEDLNRLTDSELHHKLLMNGFPNVPVTETTRRILIRKLETFLKNKKSPQQHRISDKKKRFAARKDNFNRKSSFLLKQSSSEDESSFAYDDQRSREVCARNSQILYDLPPLISSEKDKYSGYRDDGAIFKNRDCVNNLSANIKVVNKLLKYREQTVSQNHMKKGPGPDEMTASILRGYFTKPKGETFYQKLWNGLTKKNFSVYGVNQTIVPYVLISALFIFLLTISTLYMSQLPRTYQLLDDQNLVYDTCSDSSIRDNQCIEKKFIETAIKISQAILNVFSDYSQKASCDDSNLLPTITLNELYKYWNEKAISLPELRATEYIISKNPQWNLIIQHPLENCAGLSEESCLLDNNELSFKLNDRGHQIKCSIIKKVRRFFLIVGGCSLLIVLFLLAMYITRLINDKKNQNAQIVNKMVVEITNTLLINSTQKANSEGSDIILNHLRDKIIPLNDRKKLLPKWNEAIKILEQNDSRITFGSTVLNGEHYRTIKMNIDLQNDKDEGFSKKWNSPAFDNMNRIIDPPTPCLKIRHMFDSSEIKKPNLKEALYKAILVKVGNNCRILDFQIDTQSCCVYVRCASEKDAGIMHREINGWWFDKRLVSIKFLHLDRYLQRFPNSC